MAQGAFSLEGRIRRQLLIGLLVVMAALLSLVHVSVTRLTQSFVVSRLEDDAESLIAALSRAPDGDWALNQQALLQAYQRVQSGHYYQLSGEQASFRSRSLWDFEPELTPEIPAGQPVTTETAAFGDQQWLVLEQSFIKQGERFRLWVAEDIADLKADQRAFELWLLALLGLSVPALLVMQRRILHSGFARLEPVRQTLAQQQAGELVRLPEEVPAEVVPLVNSIQQLLQQSGQQISRSRMALGNLAHELKRPLQQLRWLSEQQQEPEVRQELMQLYAALYERIERELRRARIAGSPGPGRQFNPRAEMPHLTKLLHRIGSDAITLESELPPGAVPFDRDDMLELLGNLLDNAWRYARQRVRIRFVSSASRPGEWELSVEDDGPGVSEADLTRIAARGVRVDEAASEGSGLGLSICQAIVESYGGEMQFSRSELGGLKVDLRLTAG
ncbi:sensor histidine kinase [Marinobacterium sp. AK62]|uniref:histidine kinase n=1 Tax=Marinobacterium alkalitolerans TaxID=1542925 RepID=A0ABS3ZAI1_9GAMM|nr:sensor histidine kinase [Marinobacterium alkalitolerans]MBP0048702.1 sensor histidine kinase [Marinobacterium alkalitolerans]